MLSPSLRSHRSERGRFNTGRGGLAHCSFLSLPFLARSPAGAARDWLRKRAADGQSGRESVRLEERREALLAKLDGKTRPPGTTRGETEDIEGEEGGRGGG